MTSKQRLRSPFAIVLALYACNVPDEQPDVLCGAGTSLNDGVCVADEVPPGLDCGPGTYAEAGECLPDPVDPPVDTDIPPLERGYFEEPIVWLQKQVGQGGALGPGGAGQTHMHISEMVYREGTPNSPAQVFACSYTFSVLNANDPQSMSYMAQGWLHYPVTGTRAPGCVNLSIDDNDPDIIYTTHHGNLTDGTAFLSGWDIQSVAADPLRPTAVTLSPLQLPMLQEGNSTSYEGLDNENGYIYVALHDEGLGVFERDAVTGAFSRVSTFTGVLENAWEVRVVGTTAYVADGPGGLVILDVTDPQAISLIGRVGFPGVAHDIVLDGTTAYIAAQSGGLVVVDASTPSAPAVIASVEVPGSAVAIDYDAGRVYLGAWNDARVYDVSNPSDPQIIGGKRIEVYKAYTGDGGDRPEITDRVLGIAGKGDFIFDGTWWTPNSLQIHADRLAPYIYLPETLHFLTFPGDLATGETSVQNFEIRNDGTAPLTVTDMWAENPLFTAEPSELQIPAGGSAWVTLTFTAGATIQEERTIFHIASDDPGQPVRDAYLVGNPAGIAVGDPMPETTGTLLGSLYNAIKTTPEYVGAEDA
ncbi:MAG: alkyl hydroperoxide reductase [Phycisphaerales bacterium]